MTRDRWIPSWFALTAAALASACSTTPHDERDTPAGAAGTGSTPNTASFTVVPDATGWLDLTANDLGLQGSWYPYGDRYGAAKCTTVGMHPLDTCSLVTSPAPPPATGFPNEGGKMCTSGQTAVILPCATGVTTSGCPASDYSNMWGAGIGLDFGLPAEGGGPPSERDPLTRVPWNAIAHGVTGVSFDFSWNDPSVRSEPYVRVGFPMLLPDDEESRTIEKTAVLRDGSVVMPGKLLPVGTTSEDHPSGSPFADAPPDWTNDNVSAIRAGYNEIRWSRVKAPPESHYEFNPRALYGVLFQVPTSTTGRLPYAFCVSHLALLRD